MKKLFILGAGASRELKFITSKDDADTGEMKSLTHLVNGLLSSGFFFYINEFIKDIKKIDLLGTEIKIYNDWLLKFILDYYYKKNGEVVTINELLNNEAKSKKINIEEIYIAIEELLTAREQEKSSEYPTNEEVDIFLAERELIRYIHKALSMVTYFCHSLYHRILANYITINGGDILSFNWDILFDEEMYATQKWDYSCGYGFKPKDFIDKNKIMRLPGYGYQECDTMPANIIYKPHGSLNWYKKSIAGDWGFVDNTDEIYIGIPMTRSGHYKGGTLASIGQLSFTEGYRDSADRYESLILPPGRKRKKFPSIWENIKRALELTDHLICIGFSFNDFDSHIIDEFKEVKFKNSLKIDIVNPDLNIVEKYKNIFKATDINRSHSSFSDYCAWITRQKGMESFSGLVAKEG